MYKYTQHLVLLRSVNRRPSFFSTIGLLPELILTTVQIAVFGRSQIEAIHAFQQTIQYLGRPVGTLTAAILDHDLGGSF